MQHLGGIVVHLGRALGDDVDGPLDHRHHLVPVPGPDRLDILMAQPRIGDHPQGPLGAGRCLGKADRHPGADPHGKVLLHGGLFVGGQLTPRHRIAHPGPGATAGVALRPAKHRRPGIKPAGKIA